MQSEPYQHCCSKRTFFGDILGRHVLARRRGLGAMGIRDKPTALASPCQNGIAERLIGSIRRECVDHIVVLSEPRLRRILQTYAR